MIEKIKIERTKGGSIVWEASHLSNIKRLYESGLNLTEIGKIYDVSYGTIKNKLKNMDVKILNFYDKNPRNSHFFHPWRLNAESVYWLGYMYADGYVNSKSNEISITSNDKEHLVKFKEALQSTNKITSWIDNRFQKPSYSNRFAVKDPQMKRDLIFLGCFPQKSLTLEEFPELEEDLISHFIRGYFEGDGSLHYTHGGKRFRISFLGTIPFLNEIKRILGTENSLSKGTGKAYVLQIAGQEKVLQVLEYMYRDSEEKIRLNRKYNLYQEILSGASPLNLEN